MLKFTTEIQLTRTNWSTPKNFPWKGIQQIKIPSDIHGHIKIWLTWNWNPGCWREGGEERTSPNPGLAKMDRTLTSVILVLLYLADLSNGQNYCSIHHAKVANASSRSLSLSWSIRGDCANGVIIGYSVKVSHKEFIACRGFQENFKSPASISVDAGKTTFATVFGLRPYSKYKIEIGKKFFLQIVIWYRVIKMLDSLFPT